ncbi:murein hydrolase activator EnvC family protein [Niallia sp. 01092]|uniref:murein hydrolase activator EnvC family protein n=1 Tax=unclassified Niallia TaxID=2837522 RepID=UPI003FCFB0C6
MKKLTLKTSAIKIGIAASFTLFFIDSSAFASSVQDLHSKKDVQENRSEVESGINKVNQELNQLHNEQDKINSEIQRLDMLISDINQKIRDKNEEITNTKIKIEELKKEISELQDRIKKREELLKERVRLYQQTGSISYLDVIMGSQSFSDFIDRVGAVATIVNADGDLIRQHLDDKELLEKKQIEINEKLESLQQYVNDMEIMKKNLDVQKKEKDDIMASLKTKEESLENEKLNLEEEQSLLTAQNEAIGKAIDLENTRKKDTAGQASTENNSFGVWIKPAEGRLTSTLGERWNKFHAGIDIANSADVPIVAASDGVVSRSYYSSSYGNVVFISHSIDGQIYTTVYAHMDNRSVQAGETVSKGQQIGIMGNTGHSFGQHLHFEMHKGEWNQAKSNAINPLDYMSI